MAAERVKFYKLLVVDIQLAAPATLTFSTGVASLEFELQAGSRQPVKLRMPGTARGRYAQVQIAPTGQMRLFGMTLYGRRVGESAEASWAWIPGPVEGTPEGWSTARLPIPETPDAWSEAKLPIPSTPDAWSETKLPIPSTPDAWSETKLPIPATAEEWGRVQLPIPASSDLPEWAALPLDS